MKRARNFWNNISAPSKASIVFLGVSIIQKGLAYLTTPIYTNLMSTDEYGQVTVFLTWLNLIGIIAMFSLQAGVFNNGMLEYKHDRDRYMFSMLVLSNVITFVTGIVFACGYAFWKQYMQIDISLLALMFVIFLTQPAMNFWQSRQRFEYKYKTMAIVTLSSCVLSPIVAVLCILKWQDNKVIARIFGGEIVLIFFYLFFYLYIIVKARGNLVISYWKYAFLFNLPLIPHYLSQYVLSSSDKLMISYLINDTQTAFYNIAYSVAAVGAIVWTAINTSLLPFTYENCEKGDYRKISRVTMPLLLLFAAACMIVILFAPELIALMSTPEYRVAIYVVPPIVGGVFFQCMYYVFANLIYYYKKPGYVLLASLVAAVSNIILNFIFLPRYGFIAAGYTTIISYIVQVIIDYYGMKKVMGFSIYNDKLLVGMSLSVIVISLVSSFTFDYPIIRYGLFLTVLGALYFNRIKLIKIVNHVRGKEELKQL